LKPIRLYIENFMCYSYGFIDFTQFNSALIIGKIENNDLYSNGVGKTTIFKAIEYVLFNQADVNLEKIIRDDMPLCKVVLDFIIDDQEYRLSRSRTKKGSTDISLLQRNSVDGPDDQVYHTLKTQDIYQAISDDNLVKKYWKDIGGRRSADTEKEVGKLVKTNFSAFRSTLHFLQNDFTGLSTVTPNKRKGILKEALALGVYTKLEKIAKEKAASISKDIDKHKTLIDNIGSPDLKIQPLKDQLVSIDSKINSKQDLLLIATKDQVKQSSKVNALINAHSLLESKLASLRSKEKSLSHEKSKIETSIKEYQTKKSNIIKIAKALSEDINNLKTAQAKLIEIDYSQISILTDKIAVIRDEISKHKASMQSNVLRYEELMIPVPDDSVCKHCRQQLTEEHKLVCKTQLTNEIKLCNANIESAKNMISSLTASIQRYQQEINSLNLSKQKLENINTEIAIKSKEIQDKKSIHEEYKQLLDKFTLDLESKISEIDLIKTELKNSSLEEANNIQQQIDQENLILADISAKILQLNKDITHLNATKAVIQHDITQADKDIVKKTDLTNNLVKLEDKFAMYPNVIQAFSSIGIPNLIIQNVLDDLQIEANNLLAQLKPGLQLSFVIEKTKGDGTQDDTLEINYIINGKSRDYDQLSGAMKLSVIFSLKLGLSFLLQKMIGTDIRFLLLDEIDQSLDKAGVDAFADIVKFFQKDFTILIITHNDRLKDKFSHAILVDQDINMISKAQVVSSW
jgi:DNA repair exonuclease SbcCD ATPase subunit